MNLLTHHAGVEQRVIGECAGEVPDDQVVVCRPRTVRGRGFLDQGRAAVAQRRGVSLGEDRQLSHVPQTGAHPLPDDLADTADRNDLFGRQIGRLQPGPRVLPELPRSLQPQRGHRSSTIRPRGPVPVTVPRSTCSSRARRRATGEAMTRPPAAAGGAGRPGRWGRALGGGRLVVCAGSDRLAGGRAALGCRVGCLDRGGEVGVGVFRRSDKGEQADHFDRSARLGLDVCQPPAGRRLDLGVDLVGFDLQDGFIRLDGIALLLEPARDLAFGHGQTELRHLQWNRHLAPPLSDSVTACVTPNP